MTYESQVVAQDGVVSLTPSCDELLVMALPPGPPHINILRGTTRNILRGQLLRLDYINKLDHITRFYFRVRD